MQPISSEQFERRLGQLNPKQRQAVEQIEGPLLVIAGPGSGKTELLSLRVANILLTADVNPGNILCLTFTESAAANMRDRLIGLIGQAAYHVAIHTFHSFGSEVINRHPEYFYQGANFQPVDDLVQIEILGDIFATLPHDNPLASYHPEQGYVFLKDVKQRISECKRAGLSASDLTELLVANRQFLEQEAETIHELFSQTVRNNLLPKVGDYVAHLQATESSLAQALAHSLAEAVGAAEATGKATPLSTWKSTYTQKEGERRILKDAHRLPKLEQLAVIYQSYQEALHQRGAFDYDDMLLEVIQTVNRETDLQAELQEQFLYICVDEFQDTNQAQMQLLHTLTDSPINEGRPNIMAVGDDDQAIYRFQGAEIANLYQFHQRYRDPIVITLTENYRSTQAILDLAKQVIAGGRNQLQAFFPEIEKRLIAANPNLPVGEINSHIFQTRSQENTWVAQEIRRLIEAGESPGEIAIIAREHSQLETLVPHLVNQGIPLQYERQQNVFEEPHVHQLITLARFTSSLSKKRLEADEFLPEILSYPFWNLSRLAIWQLSLRAHRERRTWLECMLEEQLFQPIAEFFIELAGESQIQPFEQILDQLIGSIGTQITDQESEEEVETTLTTSSAFISPFRRYYFGQSRPQDNPHYVRFLSGLRVFIQKSREYGRANRLMSLENLIEFVDAYENNQLKLIDTSPYINSAVAVQLLTAHKAKGMEFANVFVLNCQDDIWAGRGRSDRISLPLNLPIGRESDELEDQLRIFYVALTRAKHRLYLTSFETHESGKSSVRLQFLLPAQPASNNELIHPSVVDSLTSGWSRLYYPPIVGEEPAIFAEQLRTYQLSITHLNNFLDLVGAGPQHFFEENLLRFPQGRSRESIFGSIMHELINRIQSKLRLQQALTYPEAEHWFIEKLSLEPLSQNDQNFLQGKGLSALQAFYKQIVPDLKVTDRSEVDFKHQGAVINQARLTGKIDHLRIIAPGNILVTDYKTGRAAKRWQGRDDHEKIKLWKYRNQLLFYKLLVEGSREFSGHYQVEQGRLVFLEPDSSKQLTELTLTLEIDELERLKRLITVVFQMIQSLEFPSIESYPKTLEGIRAFEDDLLANH